MKNGRVAITLVLMVGFALFLVDGVRDTRKGREAWASWDAHQLSLKTSAAEMARRLNGVTALVTSQPYPEREIGQEVVGTRIDVIVSEGPHKDVEPPNVYCDAREKLVPGDMVKLYEFPSPMFPPGSLFAWKVPQPR